MRRPDDIAVYVRISNAQVQLQAHYHHCGEAASEKCLSAATFVRWRHAEFDRTSHTVVARRRRLEFRRGYQSSSEERNLCRTRAHTHPVSATAINVQSTEQMIARITVVTDRINALLGANQCFLLLRKEKQECKAGASKTQLRSIHPTSNPDALGEGAAKRSAHC